jgi:hypothetical protein
MVVFCDEAESYIVGRIASVITFPYLGISVVNQTVSL